MGRQRRFPPPRRIVAVRFATLALLAGLAAWQFFFPADRGPPPVPQPGATAFVERAVDGDTLLLADRTRIRLLGVDTPETKRPDWPVEPFGLECYEFTQGARRSGAMSGSNSTKSRREQIRPRVWRTVYVDDWFLNEELIRAGLGRAITNHPYSESMKRRFRAAQDEARRERRGIWGVQR